ncbi:hypothetical protein [Kitasatospora sp. GAS1066B]|uniref:hypothetical protein n=1 Tax=Kitasatospora sp. GAS1066B TaxID=3156271 RepID=UPI0035186BF6
MAIPANRPLRHGDQHGVQAPDLTADLARLTVRLQLAGPTPVFDLAHRPGRRTARRLAALC